MCLRALLSSPLPSRVPPSGPRPPDDICTLLRSPPDFLRVSLSLLWCLGPNQDTSVLLFSHPFGAPPFSPWSPEDICSNPLWTSSCPRAFLCLSLSEPLCYCHDASQGLRCSLQQAFSSFGLVLLQSCLSQDLRSQVRPFLFFSMPARMPPETFLVPHSTLVALCLPFNVSYPSEPFMTPLLPVTVPPQTPSLCTTDLFELCSRL